MEELRDKLVKSINENGRLADKTVMLSQQLDEFIVAEMRGETECTQNVANAI